MNNKEKTFEEEFLERKPKIPKRIQALKEVWNFIICQNKHVAHGKDNVIIEMHSFKKKFIELIEKYK